MVKWPDFKLWKKIYEKNCANDCDFFIVFKNWGKNYEENCAKKNCAIFISSPYKKIREFEKIEFFGS